MLSGRVAFPAPTAYARLAAVVSMDPEPLERIDPALQALSGFVVRALKKNRDERFASALEMARALAAAAPSVVARSDGSVGRISVALPLSHLPELPAMAASGLAPAPAAAAHPRSFMPATTPAEGIGPPYPTPAEGFGRPYGAPVEGIGRPTTQPLPDAPATSAIFDTGNQVVVITQQSLALGETLPSKDLPVISRDDAARRGVPFVVVILLVAAALGAGLLSGWILAHMS
jgi:hypothetical protein